jgi:hypothetical protein
MGESRACPTCGRPCPQRTGNGRPARWCSDACRPNDKRTPCIDCGARSWGERCRACANQACVNAWQGRTRSDDDPIRQYYERDRSAPGLTRTERARLLQRWKQQGRRCAYCPSLATTVDHVVPLVRGGTNYEGNLAPACRPCNSSKASLMLAEWRSGKRLAQMPGPLPWLGKPVKPKPIKALRWAEATPLSICPCGVLHARPKYCSDECRYEYGIKQRLRDRYRIKAGIPLDAPLYSRVS